METQPRDERLALYRYRFGTAEFDEARCADAGASERTQCAMARASLRLTLSFATIGMLPQLPAPPLMILRAKRSSAAGPSAE